MYDEESENMYETMRTRSMTEDIDSQEGEGREES